MRTNEESTEERPSAEASVPPPPDDSPSPSLREMFAAHGLPTRLGRPAPKPAVVAAPVVSPPPETPERPVEQPPPQPTVGPASAPFDGLFARLMASVKPEPPVARLPNRAEPATGNGNPRIPISPTSPHRPEVGPRVGAEIPELARALEWGGAQAVDDLVAALAARWKDRKLETRAFWTSALAEVQAGTITADLVAALVKDADRKSVKHKARQFSQALGQELAAARQARKNRPPGRCQTTPAGGQKAVAPTSSHFTMNGSSRK